MSSQNPLPGSERAPLAGARDTGPCADGERFEVTLLVRARAGASARAAAQDAVASGRFLDRAQIGQQLGADPADLEQVERFAADQGLAVLERSIARRSVVLSGTAAAIGQAFGVGLHRYRHPDGEYRGHAGPVHVPDELRDVVVAVLGLDDRPQARPHFRRRDAGLARPDGTTPAAATPAAAAPAAGAPYTPPQVADLYQFPQACGAGCCVGILELGGGYRPADLDGYFSRLGTVPAPTVVSVSVDQSANAPTGDPSGPDGEVALDIEVVGAIAPGARIAVYFAPNTDRGFVDGVTTAIHDAQNAPDVLSISWGGPEETWSGQARQALDDALAAAVALGIPVLVAAGDHGSSDGVGDGQPHVDFPASSPHAVGCGGTRLTAAAGAIAAEAAWNDGNGWATGGGVSVDFPLPAWQAGAGVPAAPNGFVGRGVPDVAGDADPATGYDVLVDGTTGPVGGTSAVAPLWAALLARVAELRGVPLGFPNPALYSRGAALGAMRDVTQGSNGAYEAGPGWDPCTGLGSPDGPGVLELYPPPGATSA